MRSDDLGGRRAKNFCGGGELAFDGGGLSIKLHDKHRIAVGGVGNRFSGGGEGERVGDLEGAGEKSRSENLLDSRRGFGDGGELGPQAGAGGWEWNQAQGSLGNKTEHPLGAGEETDEIEPCAIFMSSSAEADDRAVAQDNF